MRTDCISQIAIFKIGIECFLSTCVKELLRASAYFSHFPDGGGLATAFSHAAAALSNGSYFHRREFGFAGLVAALAFTVRRLNPERKAEALKLTEVDIRRGTEHFTDYPFSSFTRCLAADAFRDLRCAVRLDVAAANLSQTGIRNGLFTIF